MEEVKYVKKEELTNGYIKEQNRGSGSGSGYGDGYGNC